MPVNYRDNELELQSLSISAYVHAFIVLKEHYNNVLFVAADVGLHCSVVRMVGNVSELCSLFPEIQTLKLATRTEENSRSAIGRLYLAAKRAELLHRGYVVLGSLRMPSKCLQRC